MRDWSGSIIDTGNGKGESERGREKGREEGRESKVCNMEYVIGDVGTYM